MCAPEARREVFSSIPPPAGGRTRLAGCRTPMLPLPPAAPALLETFMPASTPTTDSQLRLAMFVDFENIALGLRGKQVVDVRKVLDRLLENGRAIVDVT